MKSSSIALFLLLSAFQQLGSAFQVSHYSASLRSTTQLFGASYDQVAEIGYGITVQKPVGVVFGENGAPYFGLVIDDVSEGLNGGIAGLRRGDQVLSINGEVVVGQDFDSVMGALQAAPTNLDLIMYRGPVSTVYTILSNMLGDDDSVLDDDEGDEPVIMDENYESPVRIEVVEQKPLTAGDVFKALGKLGKMVADDLAPAEQPKEKKKGGGFFGMGAEAIQLDGDDANTLK